MRRDASVDAPPVIDWGVATLALAGEMESGDLHLVKRVGRGTLVAAVDGPGHGAEAAAPPRAAVAGTCSSSPPTASAVDSPRDSRPMRPHNNSPTRSSPGMARARMMRSSWSRATRGAGPVGHEQSGTERLFRDSVRHTA